ncbi:uncharacterized protein LOC117119739 [Anneissia japonica]|uniref:uncharacterized protein LOC117119739 n=1 Tax=Anneissia japonica TaxID=1529436 RepID=UPI0014256EE9|nr:uncharacterized protein LOC117119739 [Anneissia japonica]
MYFLMKRSTNIHRFDDFINNTVIKKDQKNEINAERALDDFEIVAYLKRDFAKSEYEEALDFGNDKEKTVARGECIKASFKSNYNSDHVCFQEMEGYHSRRCTLLLLSRTWPENILRRLYPPDEKLKDKIKGNCNVNDSHGPVEFTFELKGLIKKGAAAEGYLRFKDVTDDVEGQYVYLLQIKHEKRSSGALQKIKHTFFGKTCIQLSNPVYRSNVDKKQFISPIGIVLSDQVYAFALKMEKEKKEEQREDKTILRYITCAGKLHSEDNKITIRWNDFSKVLLKPEEELLSFVALPGRYHSYIFLGFINVSKDRRLLGKVFSFLPDGSFNLINNIVETLESKGPVEILKFDPHSGKKLSNGRIIVGGWIKRGYQKRKRMDELKLRFTCCKSSSGKLDDVENQAYGYQKGKRMDELKFTGSTSSSGELDDVENQAHGYQKGKRMDELKFTGSTSSSGKLDDVENQAYSKQTKFISYRSVLLIIHTNPIILAFTYTL